MATVFEVRDELWELVEPMIPPVRQPERQGRRPVPDQVCFNAIVFVLVTGIAGRTCRASWAAQAPPRGGACVTGSGPASGSACTARCLTGSTPPARSTGRRRWSTAATSALFKGAQTGPSPVDRGRPGSKHHLLVDPAGIPLAVSLTGGTATTSPSFCPWSTASGRCAASRAARACAPTA